MRAPINVRWIYIMKMGEEVEFEPQGGRWRISITEEIVEVY